MSEHFIIKCKVCDKVISQCRCFNPAKKVSYDICDDCKECSAEASDKFIRTVELIEYYTKEEGVVYWHYRFGSGGDWHKEKTPFTDIPIVKVNF